MMVRLLAAPVRAYRRWLSPLKPPVCRFVPTCSAYAIEALETHGAMRGAWLATRRICRCHPWGGHGFDPVPAIRRPTGGHSGGEPSNVSDSTSIEPPPPV